jgi:hypothetical protein
VVGAGIGTITAGALLPRLVLTEAGQMPSPAWELAVPWTALGTALLGVVALSSTVLAAMVSRVVSRPLGDELRRGEDT